jgi:mannosyltransferase
MKISLFRRRRPKIGYRPLFDWAAVIAGIMLFTWLVLPNLVISSAYFDEGYSAYLAKFDPITIAAYTAQDVHPPLYYVVLHYWQSFVGDGVSELRLLSVIFAWIAIVFGFILVRRWFGRRAAWLALGLTVISPLLIRYGSTMRMYTMALAIAFAGTYVLLRAVHSKGKRWWLMYAALVAAGMWTNYFMALVWVTHLLWLIYEYRKDRRMVRSWRMAFLGAIVLYLPWLPMMLLRYSEVQADGFWIKSPTLDTLVSTVTQSVVFRSAAETTSWLAVGIIALVIGIIVAIRQSYPHLKDGQKPVFRLVVAMSTLPVILLAIGSLPPLRPSYVYRYVLVAAIASGLLIAIAVTFAKFKRHQLFRRCMLGLLAVSLFVCGAWHAYLLGNVNLDTDKQNRLSDIMMSVHKSSYKAPVVFRSPYSYYVGRFYDAKDFDVHFLYSDNLAKVGSTKPLADHPDASMKDFKSLDKVWLVGEDIPTVLRPSDGKWVRKDCYFEYDDATHDLVAVAAYYERIK